MFKQYFKQAIQMLRENRLISIISIAGTAISIAMIMVVVLTFQIQFANYYPENDRDRMLYVEAAQVKNKAGTSTQGAALSLEAVKVCFYSLKTPESVSAYISGRKTLSLPDKRMYTPYTIKYTDPAFWHIFTFRFVAGKPFTQADFDSYIPQAVVSESVARKLYGTTDVVGKPVVIDIAPYTICGVVKDVSTAANTAYASVWVPYTSDRNLLVAFNNGGNRCENMLGKFNVCLLAGNSRDFDAIRQEITGSVARYNSTKQDWVMNIFENPLTRFDIAIGSEATKKAKFTDYLAETGGLLLFLLLVPALNLLGVTHSAIQKRRAEMGVRKAFGATYGILIRQVLYENCVTTLFGGVIGLILSFIFLPFCKDFMLLDHSMLLNTDMLFQPGIFVAALLFSLLMNLLSAGIPATRIARQQITDSLNDRD